MPSYEKSKNGTWSVRFRTLEQGIIKNKRLSGYKTKKDAQYGYEDFVSNNVHRIDDVVKEDYEPLLIEDVYDKYIKYKSLTSKENYIINIGYAMRIYVIPYFKCRDLRKLDSEDAMEYACHIKSKVSNINSYNEIMIYTLVFFNYLDNVYGVASPFRHLKLMAKKDRKINHRTITTEEFQKMLECFNGKQTEQMILKTLFLSGCRKGEVSALEWNDIDFENCTIRINKTYNDKTKKITSAKSIASNRFVRMPSRYMEELKEYKEKVNPKYVFGDTQGLYYTRLKRILKKSCEYAGISNFKVHDLRHSCASLLLSNGASISSVSNRLGHSSINVTLECYAHEMPQDADKIISILEKEKA